MNEFLIWYLVPLVINFVECLIFGYILKTYNDADFWFNTFLSSFTPVINIFFGFMCMPVMMLFFGAMFLSMKLSKIFGGNGDLTMGGSIH